MKRIKVYTKIWSVDKVFYQLGDFTLPRPVTASQLIWFFAFFVLSVLMKGIPPFIFSDSILMNNVAIPIVLAIFVNKKSFDGKKPYSFFKSIVLYYIHPKNKVRNKVADIKNDKLKNQVILIGREEGNEFSD